MKQMHYYYLVSDQYGFSHAWSNIPVVVFNWILKLDYNI